MTTSPSPQVTAWAARVQPLFRDPFARNQTRTAINRLSAVQKTARFRSVIPETQGRLVLCQDADLNGRIAILSK